MFNKKIFTLSVIISILLFPLITQAQSGIKFPELKDKLKQYFDEELIEDLHQQMPQGSDYTIWGWDVGDFSGDGNLDVALSLKLSVEKRKVMQVYFFVDVDGYLVKASQFPYEFVELPLEIGVAIRNNVCYVTKKKKQDDWLIVGYQFSNGCLMKYDEYTSNRIDSYTHESYRNYLTMRNTEKYTLTQSGNEKFTSDYLTIPCYPRDKLVPYGYSSDISSNYIDYVSSGAYYWTGDSDASFRVSSAYDKDYIYMSVYVRDDKVVAQSCDSCPGDYIDVWFDVNQPNDGGNRFTYSENNRLKFRKQIDSGIFRFSFYPGDFLDKKAYSKGMKKVSSTDELESFQRFAASKIKVVSSPTNDGYVTKFRIPFLLFGFEGPSSEDTDFTEFGCTVAVYDIDNEYRPEEATVIATSKFDEINPATYGSIILIPPTKLYGESINIYQNDLIKTLSDNGF